MKRLVIIGGGAAGLLCGALTAENGIETIIIEHTDKPGKKILSTGNGKCNMTNTELSADKYYCEENSFVENIINKFGYKELTDIFKKFGLLTRERNGYIYPYSEQATAVREILLDLCLANKAIIKTECEVENITENDGKFIVSLKDEIINSDYLVIATGGKSFPKSGSDGSGYKYALQFGHSVNKTVPALTALICHEKVFKLVSGVRVKGNIYLYDNDRVVAQDFGEIQLTDYGISGIPVFNISRVAAYVLKTGRKPYALLDFMPDYNFEELKGTLSNIFSDNPNRTVAEQLTFIINKKLAGMLLKILDINTDRKCGTITNKQIELLVKNIKEFKTFIANIKGFEFAQVTAGGVSVDSIDSNTMESKLKNNLFFAGEVIDVDGICGGYNLHFAWASAYLAAEAIKKKG